MEATSSGGTRESPARIGALATLVVLAAFVVEAGLWVLRAIFVSENFSQESGFCRSPDPVMGAAEHVDCADAAVAVTLAGPPILLLGSLALAVARRSAAPLWIALYLLSFPVAVGIASYVEGTSTAASIAISLLPLIGLPFVVAFARRGKRTAT